MERSTRLSFAGGGRGLEIKAQLEQLDHKVLHTFGGITTEYPHFRMHTCTSAVSASAEPQPASGISSIWKPSSSPPKTIDVAGGARQHTFPRRDTTNNTARKTKADAAVLLSQA